MTLQQAETMIGFMEDEGFEFSDWESDFLTSLSKQIDERKFISQKQSSKLEDIYAQKSGGGQYQNKVRT